MREHKKVLLAGDEETNLVFCENCQIAELTIGGVSVRLTEQSLYQLHTVLHEGLMKLSVLKATAVPKDFDYDSLNLH